MKTFSPYQLDTVNQCLWRRRDMGDDERLTLAPKAYAVLRYLVEHGGRLITQDELLDALWPRTYVQPEVLKRHILDVRSALGDDPKHPLFIKTLPRRGYQFIAAVSESAPEPTAPAQTELGKLVGRQVALESLRDSLRRASRGELQVVFVTGEPGIGKTALVDAFLRQTAVETPDIHVASGQCIEGYGGKEAYYPMLQALGQLSRGLRRHRVVEILAARAPTWLVQFPALIKPEHREMLQREIAGATRDRMLREIREALETITAAFPLLLVFEDMQWGDLASVDLISALARDRGPAKLMLIATYRALHVASADHPLQSLEQDLLAHRQCHEIAVEPLTEGEVADYLVADASEPYLPAGLAALVHRQSAGNPLFMVAALEHMAQRGLITRENGRWQLRVPLEEIELGVPETLRRMIEAQIERLTREEQRALEVASVSDVAFSVSVGAAGMELDPEAFEELCENLSRRHRVIRAAGSQRFPDGSGSPRYEFVHALYREVFYRRQPPGRRAKVHSRIAEHLEAMFSARLNDAAPELAHHFESGADWARAIKYLRLAADMASRRYAHREATALLQRALQLSCNLADDKRALDEIETLGKLATLYLASNDLRAIDTYDALAARAAEGGLMDVELRALIDMAYPVSWISAQRCLEVIERALQLSAKQPDPLLRARTRMRCLFWRAWAAGWNLRDADDSRTALAEIRECGDRVALGHHLIDYSLMQLCSSEYREGRRSVTDGLAILLEGHEGNPYLSTAYRRSEIILRLSLLFDGELGEALYTIEAGLALANKSGDAYRSLVLRLWEAWVRLHALDFAGVVAICEAMFPLLGEPRLIGPLRMCLVLAGSAETALGSYERALKHLMAARDGMARQMVIRDWYWRMPLEASLTELWLSTGDLDRARTQAQRFLDVTLATAERTWQALAWEANARVAMAELDLARAQYCVANAVSTMECFEVPLAAWRVHATIAEFHERNGNAGFAKDNRALSRAVILKLAGSLPAEEPLRKTFLSAPAVLRILAGSQDVKVEMSFE
jgi:DNA-binding winged helix-turn-helix (wHTH) protein